MEFELDGNAFDELRTEPQELTPPEAMSFMGILLNAPEDEIRVDFEALGTADDSIVVMISAPQPPKENWKGVEPQIAIQGFHNGKCCFCYTGVLSADRKYVFYKATTEELELLEHMH